VTLTATPRRQVYTFAVSSTGLPKLVLSVSNGPSLPVTILVAPGPCHPTGFTATTSALYPALSDENQFTASQPTGVRVSPKDVYGNACVHSGEFLTAMQLLVLSYTSAAAAQPPTSLVATVRSPLRGWAGLSEPDSPSVSISAPNSTSASIRCNGS
jgi:hypothetical protein